MVAETARPGGRLDSLVEKLSDYRRVWNRRRLVLEGGLLIAFKDKDDERPQRVVALTPECRVRSPTASDDREFRVYVGSLRRWHYFRCTSHDEAVVWANALKDAIAAKHHDCRQIPVDEYVRERMPEWVHSLLKQADSDDGGWVLEDSDSPERQTWTRCADAPATSGLPTSKLAIVAVIAVTVLAATPVSLSSFIATAVSIAIICAELGSSVAVHQTAPLHRRARVRVSGSLSPEIAVKILLDPERRKQWDPCVTNVDAGSDLNCITVERRSGLRSMVIEQHSLRLPTGRFVIAERSRDDDGRAYQSVIVFDGHTVTHDGAAHTFYLTRICHLCAEATSSFSSGTTAIEAMLANGVCLRRRPSSVSMRLSPPRTPASIEETAKESMERRLETFLKLARDTTGWDLLSEEDGVTVYQKAKPHSSALPIVKGVGIVNHPAELVMHLVCDGEHKGLYDDMFESGRTIAKWDHLHLAIIHQKYKTVWPVTARDFVLTGYWSHLADDDGFVLYATDAITPDCPPDPKCVRGSVAHAGFIVQRITERSCRVTFIADMDLRGNLPHSVKAMALKQQPMQIAAIGRALDQLTEASSIDLSMFTALQGSSRGESSECSPSAGERLEHVDADDSSCRLSSSGVFSRPSSPGRFSKISMIELGERAVEEFDGLLKQQGWKPMSNLLSSSIRVSAFRLSSNNPGNCSVTLARTILSTSPADLLALLTEARRRRWFDESVQGAHTVCHVDSRTTVDYFELNDTPNETTRMFVTHWKPIDKGFLAAQTPIKSPECTYAGEAGEDCASRDASVLIGWKIESIPGSARQSLLTMIARLPPADDAPFRRQISAIENLAKLLI